MRILRGYAFSYALGNKAVFLPCDLEKEKIICRDEKVLFEDRLVEGNGGKAELLDSD